MPGSPGATIWYRLRLSRSGPFGEAGGDEVRAKLYRAALQQFEDLMKAATATGPAGRPLPLFYALSQAGRAIIAARGGPEHSHHGLTIDVDSEDLLRTSVRRIKRGAGQFQSVAGAVGSSTFSAPVPLGALMASLPELSDELPLETDWPRALSVWSEEGPHAYLRDPEILPVLIVFDEEVRTPSEVGEELSRYPAAQGKASLVAIEVQQFQELPRLPTPGGMGVRVLWRDAGAGIESVFPQHRFFGRRWLRPGVVSGQEPPSSLMTWWALLFSMSLLARYHPVSWVSALDPDSSTIAVSLERTMDEALDAIPHLVLEALLQKPVVVPGPQA